MGVINNIKFYNNTPTFHIKISSGIGKHGNSNHTENFATVEYVNNELDKKTDKTYVDSQDVLKVDKTTTVNGKELSTDIEIGMGDIAGLETTINTKVDKTYVDNQNALKADKTYVDSQDELKADKTYVDTGLSLKENIVDNNQKLALKANKSYVDNELALKADKSDTYTKSETDTKLQALDNKKLNITDFDVDKTIINNELIRLDNDKADKSELFSGDYDDLTNKPTLFSGSYNDLADKPNLDLNLYETKVDASSKFETAKTYTDTKLTDYYKKVDVDNKDVEILDNAKTYTNEKIDKLIGTAPETYDTLQEIAEYIAQDETATTAILTEIATVKTDKVDKNNPITAGRSPKITYDAKGLVTGGETLVASDIPNLDAGKITTGTFVDARIPTLAISKVTNLQSSLDNKVDKIEGKGLSTNDYTNTDKQSVEKIPTIEQDILDLESDKVDKVSGMGLSSNDYTTTEKNKLSGIQAGAQVNAVTTVAGRTGAVVLAKADVGLGSVQNYAIASKTQAESGASNDLYMTPLRTKELITVVMGDIESALDAILGV